MTISDEELRALHAAATPGPWESYFTRHGDPYVRQAGVAFSFITSPTNDRTDAHTQVSTEPSDYGLANAELIAAAVNALPSLLDRLAAQADEIAALRQGIWDAYGILGFDQHGDPTPAALTAPPMDDFVRQFATEVRTGTDEAAEEYAALAARLAALEAQAEPTDPARRYRDLLNRWALCGLIDPRRFMHDAYYHAEIHALASVAGAADGGATPEPDDEASDEADDGPICGLCGVRRPEPGHTACGRCA